ncbi:MAG: ATPase domain-containing protein [Terriglobia bacterium]
MNITLEKMPTGIAGFDHLLEGGLVRGNSLLIEGPPGSGKSTLAVRILYEGALQFQEPGLLITFDEFPKQIYQEALAYGVDLRPLEEQGLLRVIWTPPGKVFEGFNGRNDLVDKIIGQIGVRRLVIDSITHFKRVAPSEVDLRELLTKVLNHLKLKEVNAILIKELDTTDPESVAFEEYLVDASMRVYNRPAATGGENLRLLEIRKTRGQGHISGRHPFRLGGEGLRVFPQLRPTDVSTVLGKVEIPRRHRVSVGISGLDTMLEGGFWSGTLNLAVGYPGTGKSVIAQHFIDAGLRRSEPALLLSIKNTPEQILDQASSLSMNWSDAYISGLLRILHFHPSGLCVEEMFQVLVENMREGKPKRLVFDSVNDLWSAVKDEDRIRDYVLVLKSLFEAFGTTTIMMNETSQMGGSPSSDAQDYAHLASCVIQLSMAESEGELRRFIGIRKHTGSNHAKELREFHIDSRGLRVERKATGLSGILTGQTQGALRQVADEVLPSLDQVADLLRAVSDSEEPSNDTQQKIQAARSNLGLLDVILREHFGVTQFHKLSEEELPAASENHPIRV